MSGNNNFNPSNPATVQSIDRVLSIIEALSSAPRGMALTELAEITNLNKSTVHRMLATLSTWNYVAREADSGKYRLTMRLFEIGSRVIGGNNILSVARPFLEHLSDETNEAIHLVIHDNNEIVYLYKEDSSNSVLRMSSRVGLRNPMYCTAVGKSILAALPEKTLANIWNASAIVRFTPKTITDYQQLLEECERIRAQGYAIDDEEHERGIRCVGVAIMDFSGKPIAAISVAAPVFRLDDDQVKRVAPLVIDAANSISRLLGYGGIASGQSNL